MTSQLTSRTSNIILDLRKKVDFGDTLLLIYLVVIVRQWFWIIDNRPAWIATIPVAIAIWIYYVVRKTEITSAPPLIFWLIVGVPLLAAFLLRLPFPDASFDVWAVRLFHGERGLRGFIYWPGEFFPTAAPFNPTPDMITGLSRHAFGYRAGTVINLLALLWTAVIVEKILRQFFTRGWIRCIAVLLIVSAEHLLFEINNYMPDLLALPLLLQATELTLKQNDPELVFRRVVRVAFLIGLAVAIKLSNGAIAIPLVIVWVGRLLVQWRSDYRRVIKACVLSVTVVVLQMLPFSIWVYKLTGSPIFPLYNAIFRSPLYPPFIGWDDRWGGKGIFEILAWPVIMWLQPVRTAELPVYSGRLAVGFFAGIFCLVLWRRINSSLRIVAFTITLATLLWSITMGYIRYGLYIEVLAGLIMVMIVAQLLATLSGAALAKYSRVAVATLILVTLMVQTGVGVAYLQRREWSMRPTFFQQPAHYRTESKYLFKDRQILPYVDQHDRELFREVDVWVVCGFKTAGLMPFLNSEAKVLGARAGGLFLVPASKSLFEDRLRDVEGKRLRSFALTVDYSDALQTLRTVGLTAGKIEKVMIPIFSPAHLLPTYFFEVKRDILRPPPVRTQATGPLSVSAFIAAIEPAAEQQLPIHPYEGTTHFFRVQNLSSVTWPTRGDQDGTNQIALRARWLTADGRKHVGENFEASLPFDISPGEATVLAVDINNPETPGDYVLEVDMVQRNQATFKSKGSTTYERSIRIQ